MRESGARLSPDPRFPGDFFHLLGSIIGPANTPYEDCLFFFSINLPQDYPFRPPTVTFLTPIFHPNIDKSGSNCLNMHFVWSPALSLYRLLYRLYELLEHPDPDDPLDVESAELYKRNPGEFARVAREKALLQAW